jgi:hypothetical protein
MLWTDHTVDFMNAGGLHAPFADTDDAEALNTGPCDASAET